MGAETKATATSRAPSFFERYYVLRGAHDYYTNFNVVGQYNRRLTKVNISNALHSLISKEPRFAANFFRTNDKDFEEDGKNFVLKPLDTIKFDDVVTFTKIEKFDETTLAALDKLVIKVDVEEPVWKLVVFESQSEKDKSGSPLQHVAFYCDHALLDGTSGALFHDNFLAELSKTEDKTEYLDEIYSSKDQKGDLVPPVHEESIALHNPGLLMILSVVAQKLVIPEWIQNWASSATAYWYPGQCVDKRVNPMFRYKPTRKNAPDHIKLIQFTPAEVKSMLTKCKQNGLSLTQYQLIIAVQCLQETVIKKCSEVNQAETGSPERTIYSTEAVIAVNNRRYLPQYATTFGLFVSPLDLPIPPLMESNPTFEALLPYMKSIGATMKASLDSGYGSKIVGLLQYVKAGDFLKDKLDTHSRQTFEVSNLGLKNLQHGEWRADNLYFSQSQGVANHFGFSVVSTPTSGMNISFGYIEEYEEFPNEIAQFVKLFKERSLSFASN